LGAGGDNRGVLFIVIAIGFILFGVLSAFTFGGAIVGVVLALIGLMIFGGSFVLGTTAREGGAESTLSEVDRDKPELLGPGGPDDPDRARRAS
jgi:hypothetical protein